MGLEGWIYGYLGELGRRGQEGGGSGGRVVIFGLEEEGLG